MDFELGPEQQQLQESVRDVLARECPVALARERVRGPVPAEPWRSAVLLGWTAVAVPERFGGAGGSFVELALMAEQHGYFLAPGPFLATLSQFAPLVSEAGDDAQRERFLRAVAAGELTGSLAVAGASGSFFTPDASLQARPRGPGWLLEGVRHHVIDGDCADEIAVAARVDDGDGVALFAVPREAVKAQRHVSLDASRPLSSLEFDAVRVGPERVLGTPGRSAERLRRAIEVATAALALETVGCCQAIFDRSLAYAGQRVQFGRPIGSFQAIQHKLADMFTALEKARATGAFAALAIAEDDPQRSLATSMAKSAAGDCQRLLAREGIQIHGGIGFTWEHDIHLFVKRAKSGDALFGTAQEHRAHIAALLNV